MLSVDVSFGLDPESDRAREWDQFVQASPASGFMQGVQWARFKQQQGLNCVHIMVREGTTLIGGGAFFIPIAKKGSAILVAPEGPVLPLHDESLAEQTLDLILQECERLSEKLGAMAVRVEPRLTVPGPSLLSQFARAPSDLIPKETLYLNITGDEAGILRQMKPKGRYNIALAHRRGVVVTEASDVNSVRKFYRIMVQASKRDRFSLEPLPYFESLIETLAPHTAKLLFAEHEGEVLGTLLLITYGVRGTYLYGGITNEKRNLMGGYALQWHAIQLARQSGCSVYDFFGYDQFRSPGHPYALFSQFKSKFGGHPVRFVGGHDQYFLDRLADTVIAVLKEVDDEREKLDDSTHRADEARLSAIPPHHQARAGLPMAMVECRSSYPS